MPPARPISTREAQQQAYEALHAEALAFELEQGAEAFAAEQRFSNAEALLTEALLFAPANARLLALRASSRGALGRFNDALQDAHSAVMAAPSWPHGHAALAVAFHATKQLSRAQQAYERAAWLARESEGDLELERFYRLAALEVKAHKWGFETSASYGWFGDAPVETDEQPAGRRAWQGSSCRALAPGGLQPPPDPPPQKPAVVPSSASRETTQ
jgi:tetratricopeptide (TPR) repeat protein